MRFCFLTRKSSLRGPAASLLLQGAAGEQGCAGVAEEDNSGPDRITHCGTDRITDGNAYCSADGIADSIADGRAYCGTDGCADCCAGCHPLP